MAWLRTCEVRHKVKQRISHYYEIIIFPCHRELTARFEKNTFHFFGVRTFWDTFGISFADIISKTVFLHFFTADKG